MFVGFFIHGKSYVLILTKKCQAMYILGDFLQTHLVTLNLRVHFPLCSKARVVPRVCLVRGDGGVRHHGADRKLPGQAWRRLCRQVAVLPFLSDHRCLRYLETANIIACSEKS
jgi:hypothetical protein